MTTGCADGLGLHDEARGRGAAELGPGERDHDRHGDDGHRHATDEHRGAPDRTRGPRVRVPSHRVRQDRVRDALQTPPPSRHEADRDARLRDALDRRADEDLTGQGGRAQASGDVDGPADVALGGLDGLAGVDADPDPERPIRLPGGRPAAASTMSSPHSTAFDADSNTAWIASPSVLISTPP